MRKLRNNGFTIHRKIYLAFCLIMLLFYSTVYPVAISAAGGRQDEQYELEQVKAALVYHFSNFIQWPPESAALDSKLPFVIGFLGESPVFSLLAQEAASQKINNKPVKVVKIDDYTEIKNCSILFIPKVPGKKFKQIMEAVDELPILTIGDGKDYEKKGVMINFIPRGLRQFNVNYTAAERSGIVILSPILKHAQKVIRK